MTQSLTYVVPGYELQKRMTRTGMSSIYLAKSVATNQKTVVKILEFDSEDTEDLCMVKRFIQEFKLLKYLNHPNVARIIDRHSAEDYSCIIMEHFSKGDLSHQITKGISALQARHYLRQIAFGLEAVHARNIVHRDIKPRNILLREDNTIGISDFGIARVMEKSYGLTLQGVILGSPYYMSPEQIDNSNIDHRSDLYSLGAVFYEMLTGKKPFRGNSLMKIFYSHLNNPVPKLPPLLREYQPIIDQLLAKNPQQRFQSASELLEALDDLDTIHNRAYEHLMA